MKHLIIGASAAGIAAARKIRALRPGDEITIVAKDGAPHSRCMLHHFIGGHKSAEDINFAGADFFDKTAWSSSPAKKSRRSCRTKRPS